MALKGAYLGVGEVWEGEQLCGAEEHDIHKHTHKHTVKVTVFKCSDRSGGALQAFVCRQPLHGCTRTHALCRMLSDLSTLHSPSPLSCCSYHSSRAVQVALDVYSQSLSLSMTSLPYRTVHPLLTGSSSDDAAGRRARRSGAGSKGSSSEEASESTSESWARPLSAAASAWRAGPRGTKRGSPSPARSTYKGINRPAVA